MKPEDFSVVAEEAQDVDDTAISPEEYREILGGLALVNIGLDSIHADVTNRMAIDEAAELVPQFESSCEFQALKGPEFYMNVVLQHARLVIGDGKTPFFSLQLTFQLDYVSKQPFTKQFFQVFKHGPLVAQITPFIREYIHSTMTRMSVPPFLLPLVQVDLSPQTSEPAPNEA